jgi:hypothetical protein
MAPERTVASRTASRTASVEDTDTGIFFTPTGATKRFGTAGNAADSGRLGALPHRRLADGYGL